ncbi:MAG: sigma-70 family RNA polymerase sigma factor [Gemmatimonadetes bacterium]|nr:sigma-70 family RNA polymerase sigma factor [Gemmatimonadota bacterium]
MCAGEEQAACELLNEYERDLRILARVRLTDRALRRAIDSADICQSVFGTFFARAAMGLIELDSAEQFLKLMATMIHNKVIDYTRRLHSKRRDVRRTMSVNVDDMDLPGHEPTASAVIAGQELLEKYQARLSDSERHLAEMRKEGRSWEAIALELGGTPESQRKRLSRAVERVRRELQEE